MVDDYAYESTELGHVDEGRSGDSNGELLTMSLVELTWTKETMRCHLSRC